MYEVPTRMKVTSSRLPKGKTDWDHFDALSDEDIETSAVSDVDAQPVSNEGLKKFHRVVKVKSIRDKLSLTQEQFALKFHLSLATLRDWEQERSQPDQAARTLLKVIEQNPEAVVQALEA